MGEEIVGVLGGILGVLFFLPQCWRAHDTTGTPRKLSVPYPTLQATRDEVRLRKRRKKKFLGKVTIRTRTTTTTTRGRGRASEGGVKGVQF